MNVSETTECIPFNLEEYKSDAMTWETLRLENCRLSSEDCRLADHLRKERIIAAIDELRDGLRIKANSFVGHVAFSTFDLVIRPKFDHLATSEGKANPLATLLAYAFGFDDLKPVGEQISSEVYFAEILIHWLIGEIHSIQRRGLFQQYRRERRDLSVIRGKIDLKTWLRRGGIPSERMPCVFYRRSLDNVLNQTLCAGLRRSATIAKSPKLKGQCRYIADNFALDGVSEKTLDYRMLADARRGLNRLNAHYENAVQIVRMIYEGSGGFVLGDTRQEQLRIPGFFFDMNVLFEKVLARFFRENLTTYMVEEQRPFQVYSCQESDKDRDSIRPDYVFYDKLSGEIVLFADAKYRDVTNKDVVNTQLYQLSVYASVCPLDQRAVLLYPSFSEEQKSKTLVLNRINNQKKLAIVTLQPVDMYRLIDLIQCESKKSQREDFALEIAGKTT